MKRRRFLEAAGTGLAGTIFARRSFASAPAAKLDRIGLELYAVRNAMRANPERTMAAVRAMGYTAVELLWSFDNFGRTPQQVKATLDHEGLVAPSAHMAPETILKDWPRSLETAHLSGHRYLVIPSLTDDTKTSLDAWRSWADKFNAAGAVARKADIWLAFHNEPDHMTPIAGRVPYDVFVERLDPAAVRLQLDVGNMMVGGGNPMVYLRRYENRYWSFHLKDTTADRKSDAELGRGIFDFRAFLAAVPNLASKPCYVEQEAPKDELASAKANCDYLKKLTF